jgi:hypothetical protein
LVVPHAFDCQLLSDSLRPLYTQPLEVANLCLRAFAVKTGRQAWADQVTIRYVGDVNFDAYVFESANTHNIVVSAAAPAILQGVFFEVVRSTNPFSLAKESFANADTLPGDYRIPLELPGAGCSDVQIAAAIEQHIRSAVPIEKWQRILAVSLSELASVFLFAHELGHVLCGHVKMLSEVRFTRLTEIAFERDGPPRRIGRAWELQADQTAFAFLWSYAINTERQRNRFVRQLKCKGPEPVLDLLGRLCYAISFIFFLIAQGQNRVKSTGSHPSPLVRITFLLAMAETAMEAQFPHLANQVHACVTGAHERAEAAWNRLGLDFGVRGFSDHIEDLESTVVTARRQLKRVEHALGRHAWAYSTASK